MKDRPESKEINQAASLAISVDNSSPQPKEFPLEFEAAAESGCIRGSAHTLLSKLAGIQLKQYDSLWGKIWRVTDVNMKSVSSGLTFLPFSLFPGTVFASWATFLNLILMVGTSFLIAYCFEIPSSSDPSHEKAKATITLISQTWADGKNAIQMLTAFLIGGYISSLVSKWQTKRGLYGKLVGRTRDAIMKTACLCDFEGDHQKAKIVNQARETMVRYFNLALELAVLKSRGAMDDEVKARPFLESRALLKADEWTKLVPGDRHTTVYYWILSWARHCRREGIFTDNEFLLLAETVSDCRGVANDLLDLLPNGYPFAYLQFINLVTKLFIFFLAVTFGFNMALKRSAWQESALGRSGEKVPLSYSVVAMVMLFGCHSCYQGLLELQPVLHNPFLGDLHGVPHEPIFYGQIGSFSGWMMAGRCKPNLSPTAAHA